MVSELRKQLDNAEGTNDNIIALILDVRGFTPFCEKQESVNVANFIKRVYIQIIDDYFPDASFYKPTGDGLLIITSYNARTLKDLLVKTLEKSLSLIRDFHKLCEGDEMVNFATPDSIGIGISRGLACRISSDGTVVDYSGRVVNLASRLNDLARPCGVVFDSSLGITLLPKEIQESFSPDNVSIRGVSEDKLMTIYYTKGLTIIPPSRREPFKEPEWAVVTVTEQYKILNKGCLDGTENYVIILQRKPLDEKQITLEITYLKYEGESFTQFLLDTSCPGVRYVNKGIKHFLYIDFPILMKNINKVKVEDDTEVKFEVSYPSTRKSA